MEGASSSSPSLAGAGIGVEGGRYQRLLSTQLFRSRRQSMKCNYCNSENIETIKRDGNIIAYTCQDCGWEMLPKEAKEEDQ
jgi:ribosomal protein L37AE/L43A